LAYSVRPHGKSGSFPIPKGVSDPAYGTLADWVRGVSGRSSAKVTESDGGVARARAEAPSRASSGTPNASKPPTPDPAGSTLEREIGQVRAKLDDLTGAGRVYSNKPIAPTPSRIRAGMVQPAAPVPAAAPPATPEPQPPAPVRSSSTSVPTNSEPNKSQESRTQNSTATPASQTTPKMSPPVTAATGPFQPVDPFDPEIFNRQFAPRMK
jgi:hypothetical protein